MNILKLFREYEAKHNVGKDKPAKTSPITPPEPTLDYELPSETLPSWMNEPIASEPLFPEGWLAPPATEETSSFNPTDWSPPTLAPDQDWMQPFMDVPPPAPVSQEESLPYQLQTAWDNPDELYLQIQIATETYQVNPAILQAGRRLLELDKQPERAACIYAEALLQFGDYQEAENILKNELETKGESPTVLFQLAKAYDTQDRKALRQSALQRSLALNPNYEPALTMCLNIEKVERGHHAYMETLTFLAANEHDWLAKSRLAENFLEERNIDQAMPLLRSVIKIAKDHPNLLNDISTKLGQNQYCKELIKLILPVYKPNQHEIMVGYNLLQACVETGNKQFGEAVLQNIRDANLSNVNLGILAEFANKFAALP